MSDQSPVLVEQVKSAIDDKKSLNIEGNGTKKHLGRELNTDAETLSLAGHSGIIQYQPVELVMTARAGTTLAEIDAELEKNQQMLACDPARFNGQATIGGSLAANQSGPGRPWYGSLRDHVLGVKLIDGRGQHLAFGGSVMKNVAGYDVSRLQSGAMGTLGVITELSFKVLPKPAATTTLIAELSATEAIATMNALAAKPIPITAACWYQNKLHLRLAGANSAVEASTNALGNNKTALLKRMADANAQSFWQQLRDYQLPFFEQVPHSSPIWRCSLTPTAASIYEDNNWLLDWAGSLRWLKHDAEPEMMHNWAAQNGGEASCYWGGKRSEELTAKPSAIYQRLQKNLKFNFDPDNIFNVGRLYAWL